MRWIVLGLLGLGAGTGQADTLIRTVAYGLGADAYVQGSAAASNFGAAAVVTTRNGAGNAANNYKDYFRFDLSGSGLDLANATTVTFQFATATTRANVGFECFGLPQGLPADATNGWSESGITYNNAPGNAPGTTTLTYLTAGPGDENGNYLQSLGTLTGITASVGGVVSFSSPGLLDLVRNDFNGLVTLALRRTESSGIVQIVSKETATAYLIPTLVVEAPPVPEPSPAALAAVGFLMLLFRFSAHWTLRR